MRQPDKLPKPIRRQFLSFLENHPPQAFSNSLRGMLLDYIQSQVNNGLPVHFERFLWSLSDLFELLDMAAAHLQQQAGKDGKKKVKSLAN